MNQSIAAPGPFADLEPQLLARGLRRAATYDREIAASLERIWENVLDWEHLPWLHSASFRSVELLERGAWGWRAQVGGRSRRGDFEQTIELHIDRARQRYVSRTVEGVGRGAEIWTQLRALGPDRSQVVIEFWIPKTDAERLRARGRSLLALYERLWDEDEAMMRRRASELELLGSPAAAAAAQPLELELGDVAALRRRLPLCVTLGSLRLRIVDVGGELWAHETRCPHRLGPLEEAAVTDGELLCPWHGYRFDARSGRCLDRPRFRLQTARVHVDPESGRARVALGDSSSAGL